MFVVQRGDCIHQHQWCLYVPLNQEGPLFPEKAALTQPLHLHINQQDKCGAWWTVSELIKGYTEMVKTQNSTSVNVLLMLYSK